MNEERAPHARRRLPATTSAEETGCFAMIAFFLNFVLLGSLLMLSFAAAVL